MLILSSKFGQSACKTIIDEASHLDRKLQRRHEIWIITCYVQFALVEEYVAQLEKCVKVTNVYLAFEFSEILKFGAFEVQQELNTIRASLKNRRISFEWAALRSTQLMHGKAYGVLQRSGEDVVGGFALITSANFTKPGFLGTNIELGAVLSKKKEIRAFEATYDRLWEKLDHDIENAVYERESVLFHYALLSRGVFLHKWAGNLRQHVGIRYELTEKAKRMGSIAPELTRLGFEAGDTFTRQVLNLKQLPKKEVPRGFITKFTIETYWGRWCPKTAWEALSRSFHGADNFIDCFRAATEPEVLEDLLPEATNTQDRLIKQGLIEGVAPDHLDRWTFRINALRENARKLERYYTGYDSNLLPYSIEDKAEILDLFESIQESIKLSKTQNVAKKKLAAAIQSKNPALLALNRKELGTVKAYAKGA